jgi:hypothetical protein
MPRPAGQAYYVSVFREVFILVVNLLILSEKSPVCHGVGLSERP